MGVMMIGAGALGAAGNIGSALIGSNASSAAANQAQQGYQTSVDIGLGGQANATNALMPSYTQGMGLEDLYSYAMGLGGGSTTATPIATTPYGISPTVNFTGMTAPQQLSYLQWAQNANANNPDPNEQAALSQWGADINQLQSGISAAGAAAGVPAAAAASGLTPGYLTSQIAPYNPLTDTSFQGASQVAAEDVAAQESAVGGVGSGGQNTATMEQILGTVEPEYAQQYLNTQEASRNAIAGALTGGENTGQNIAANLSNIYTGNPLSIMATGSGNVGTAGAAGTLGSSNALTSGITGTTNALTGAVNTYANLTNQAALATILQQMMSGGDY